MNTVSIKIVQNKLLKCVPATKGVVSIGFANARRLAESYTKT